MIPDDIAPESHDDPDISVEAWRRLNAPPKARNWLRDRMRTFRFLRSPARETLLPGGGRAFSDAVIASVAFNRPDMIEWQIHLIRRHLAEKDGYVVFDNSSRDEARVAIRDLCRRLQVPYVGLPRNRMLVSASHGLALNWIARNFVVVFRPSLFGFLDHDIFPTGPFSVRERMQGKLLYGRKRTDTPTPGGWFLWPGFSFFDGSVSPRRLDFSPSYRFHMDSGGGNWPRLYRACDPDKVRFADKRWLRFGDGRDEFRDYFLSVDGWLHAGNASHWKAPQVDRREQFIALLRQAGGPDQPDVRFEPL
ncbi:hypothetical protein DPM33_06860 [Mesorhizobium hawassense]|uniref:Uncharacterized protein n=1 Tax=Mesorhizobium hawassense TaxID=1209954 RepID=A0A330HWV7_9HYPH|nr:hypothetical protein DPM33_06860 [Mesorhizobium hawassense]